VMPGPSCPVRARPAAAVGYLDSRRSGAKPTRAMEWRPAIRGRRTEGTSPPSASTKAPSRKLSGGLLRPNGRVLLAKTVANRTGSEFGRPAATRGTMDPRRPMMNYCRLQEATRCPSCREMDGEFVLRPKITDSALFRKLEARPDLHSKAVELRHEMTRYLAAVHTTFSHYTSHGVDHSDEIVRQLSSLLFANPESPDRPAIDLTDTEVYLLILGAYLHDSGMVVADREKFAAITSDEWALFAAESQLVDEARELVDRLTNGPVVGDAQELFVKALEQRLLLADYFRRRHAQRARETISGALNIRDRYLDGDPAAETTLIAICVGHGLAHSDLRNEAAYPTRRDLFDQPTDVRLLSILLRIGDLLDMRNDRACPLMQSVSSPLPHTSVAHWSQYRRIIGRVTSPMRIEIHAECETADEHRLLLDWCRWLVEEVSEAPRLMSLSDRHAAWVVPYIADEGSARSITIERAPHATYRVEDWRFVIDEAEVFNRLVNDVHGGTFGYMRELLQNALDATRARAYLESQSAEPYPNLLPEGLRLKYPIDVRLFTKGEDVIGIEMHDRGIGMTEQVIKDYFLQVGRSWYRSNEFQRRFAFSPTSRFGVGFLSVFAASSEVEVITRPMASQENEAMLLKLAGPRNYLLVEDASRNDVGTTIKFLLDQPERLSAISNYIKSTCLANEFELHVTVESGGAIEDEFVLPDRQDAEISESIDLGSKAIDVVEIESDIEGVFGSLRFPVIRKADGRQDWSRDNYDVADELEKYRPFLVSNIIRRQSRISLNGLAFTGHLGTTWRASEFHWDVDVRNLDLVGLGLEREVVRVEQPRLVGSVLETRLNEHIAQDVRSVKYLRRLAQRFGEIAPEWEKTVPIVPTFEGIRTWGEVLVDDGYWIAFSYSKNPWKPATLSDLAARALRVPLANIVATGELSGDQPDAFLRGQVDRIVEIGEVAAAFHLSEFSIIDEKRNRVQPTFDPESKMVMIEYMNKSFFNYSHPLGVALDEVRVDHAGVYSSLSSSIVGRRGRSRRSAEELKLLLTEASEATGDSRFGKFAQLIQADSVQRINKYGQPNFVRLPRSLSN
jgi:hypothetical protein